jgi:hypothetical protein
VTKSIFAKIFVIFVNFRNEIFAKNENIFSRKFRENAKTKIFVSTLLPTLAIFFVQIAKSLLSVFRGSGSSRNGCVCNHWHIAAVTERYVNGLEAESYQNLPDLESRFLNQWMHYCTDRSFEMGDF